MVAVAAPAVLVMTHGTGTRPRQDIGRSQSGSCGTPAADQCKQEDHTTTTNTHPVAVGKYTVPDPTSRIEKTLLDGKLENNLVLLFLFFSVPLAP